MESTLVKIISDSGLDKQKQDYLLEKFSDAISLSEVWAKKAKEIVVTDESQTQLMKDAREGRLLLKDKRVEIEKTRKQLKEQSLSEGRAIDTIAKTLTALIEPTEKYLDEQEKFAERKEEMRVKALKHDRVILLMPYLSLMDIDMIPNLGGIGQVQFDAMLTGYKTIHEKKIADEKKAEEDRIAKEKIDNLHKERKEGILHLWQFLSAEERMNNFGETDSIEWMKFIESLQLRKEENDKKVLEEAKKVVKEEVVQEVKKEVREEVKAEVKKEVKQEFRSSSSFRTEVKKEISDAEKEELLFATDRVKINHLLIGLKNFALPEVKSKKAKVLMHTVKNEIDGIITLINGTKI